MKNIITVNSVLTADAEVRHIDNQEHLVIPATILTQGVLNNIFYSNSEISKFPNSWNGVPVPVNHPTILNEPVSANSPNFENSTNIGRFYNTTYSDSKLTGEIWVNIEKAERLGFRDIVDNFKNKIAMEVSTGLFSDTENQKGTYNNVNYDFIAKNIRPDHIALLPNSLGACSIADGCGAMRQNKTNKTNKTNNMEKKLEDNNKIRNAILTLGANFGFHLNEISHDETRDRIANELDFGDKGKMSGWVLEVFSDYFAFMQDEKIYTQGYSESGGVITLSGDIVEVMREVEYVPVSKAKAEEKSDDDEDGDGDETTNNSKQANNVTLANLISDDEMNLFKQLKANEKERLDFIRKKVVANYDYITEKIAKSLSTQALNALEKGITNKVDYSAKAGSNSTNMSANKSETRKHSPVILMNNGVKTDGKI